MLIFTKVGINAMADKYTTNIEPSEMRLNKLDM